jgi:hypothetical protein
VDDFVGWMDLNDDRFDHKVEKYERGMKALEDGVDEFSALGSAGDVRPPFTQLIVGAGERIVNVLAAFRDAGLQDPKVHPDELTELDTLLSPKGRALFESTRPPLEF